MSLTDPNNVSGSGCLFRVVSGGFRTTGDRYTNRLVQKVPLKLKLSAKLRLNFSLKIRRANRQTYIGRFFKGYRTVFAIDIQLTYTNLLNYQWCSTIFHKFKISLFLPSNAYL